MKHHLRLTVVLVGVLGFAACAEDDVGTASFELAHGADVVPGQYFVSFKTPPGQAERDAVRAHGGQILHEFNDAAAFHVQIDDPHAPGLASEHAVEIMEPVPLRKPYAETTPSMGNGLYGLITTGATAVQPTYTGAGFVVGVADTGLDCSHPDIQPNLIDSQSFVSGGAMGPGTGCVGTNGIDPTQETHATHVSGTIVGAHNAVGVFGVAYNAKLLHARVLGPNGGSTADIMAGVRWLIVDQHVKVVNLSLGGGRASHAEKVFYDQMYNQYGALVIAASGNDSATRVGYPAAYAVNVAVGAVDRTNAIASFSNTGRNLDVVAPGVDVLSSVPAGQGSSASVTAGTTQYLAYGMEFAAKTASTGLSAPLVNCGIGNPGECTGVVSGAWIALVQRGTLSFADKVTNVTAQGASAVIIYNNTAGDFGGTLGAAGTWIPAVSVSDTAGAALLARVGTVATVTNVATSWDTYSGTSMATPHTAGVVALIWAANPTWTNKQVESRLYATAHDLGAAGYDTTFGYGLVDVRNALVGTPALP